MAAAVALTPTRTAGERRRRPSGFTLIELLGAVAIAALLAAIAYPSFIGPLLNTRRSDGVAALLQLQLRQEQWRGEHPAYAELDELGAGPWSHLHHYRLQMREVSANGYTVDATATGAQTHDAHCRILTLTVWEGEARTSSGTVADAPNSAAVNRRCWGA